jgi:hypothetical protein
VGLAGGGVIALVTGLVGLWALARRPAAVDLAPLEPDGALEEAALTA